MVMCESSGDNGHMKKAVCHSSGGGAGITGRGSWPVFLV